VQRLWLQSMTQGAIRDGFARLRPGKEMQGLGDAAVCRSESDWLVGINGTRAMTAFNSKTGGFHLTTVGRVQTPTLAIVVEREKKIREFKARSYWEVEGEFEAKAGDYTGKWFDEAFKGKEDDEHARADRLWEQARADAIRAATLGKPGDRQRRSQAGNPSVAAALRSDQPAARSERRFGFSAKTTLSLAQALYEKHKVLTYPRTDSRCLPEDYLPTVKETLSILTGEGAGKGHDEVLLARYSPFAHQILARNWVLPNKRIFNNAKISDHFAIIPTPQAPKHLNELEQKLYDFVVRASSRSSSRPPNTWSPPASPASRATPSRPKARCWSIRAGWPSMARKARKATEGNLVAVDAKEKVKTDEVTVKANETRRHRATRKPPCSPPWKAPARWSTTRN
jgi:DNA topoisomerase-3